MLKVVNDKMKIKEALFAQCRKVIDDKVIFLRGLLAEAQQAANEETKGSVGDKHETGRAMLQHERDKHAAVLAEALEQKKAFDMISPDENSLHIKSGSLVKTDEGNFLIAVGIGKIEAAGTAVFAIAPASPIGALMLGKKAGENISFNNKHYQIREVI
jgi:transcription elongation GreA/GreB family factor